MDLSALFRRALALEDAGRPQEALELYRAVLRDAPAHEDAWHNHGLLLARHGHLVQALESHKGYVRNAPDSARARCDLADVLLALSEYRQAIDTLDWVIYRDPENVPALLSRGIARSCLRDFDSATEDFLNARRISLSECQRFLRRIAPAPDTDAMLSPLNIYLSRRYVAQAECDWEAWDHYLSAMREAARNRNVVVEPAVSFMSLHLPLAPAERRALAAKIAARIESSISPLPPALPRTRSRIRIGVLSPDYRDHLNARLLLPLFELIDRTDFEIHAYSLAGDDGSAARAAIRAAADAFKDLDHLSDRQAAESIRMDDVDILIDAAGHTTGGRFGITAHRPARIQALYLGFSGTLASKAVDYAIVDRVIAPDRSEWAEQPLYLPDSYYLYDFRERVPPTPMTRSEYGLPDQAIVYCAFHKAEKITPDAFDLWMEVLAAVPNSVLWLLALRPAALERLRARAAGRGVDPRRLIMAPLDMSYEGRYLPRQRLGDLFLDALHHSAMTTACDALNAGLPMLSVRGSSMASRAAESLLRAAGLPEMVARDTRSFVETAVQLGNNPAALQALKDKLARNRSNAPLFDTARKVRDLESCFKQMLAGG